MQTVSVRQSLTEHQAAEPLAPVVSRFQGVRAPTLVGFFLHKKSPTEVGTLNTLQSKTLLSRERTLRASEKQTIMAAAMDHYDVLIVAAGPSGSFSAERLSHGSARV